MKPIQANHQISSYIIQSQEEEIKRIASELHEGVNQNLYSLMTGLKVLEAGVVKPHMKMYAREMSQLLEKTIQEMRMLTVELHPPTLTTLGLVAAMKSYCKLYTSTFGIIIDLESNGEERTISEQRKILVFRVCQEALANIAKYADTSQAKVVFTWVEEKLHIHIYDFGKGFQQPNEYPLSGIAAMKERMLLAGGECIISSKIGEGTSIEIDLPFSENGSDK